MCLPNVGPWLRTEFKSKPQFRKKDVFRATHSIDRLQAVSDGKTATRCGGCLGAQFKVKADTQPTGRAQSGSLRRESSHGHHEEVGVVSFHGLSHFLC